jgi:hypothetical protein
MRALALLLTLTLMGCAADFALYRDSDRSLLATKIALGDSHVIVCREPPILGDPNNPNTRSLVCEGEATVGGNVSAEGSSLISTVFGIAGKLAWSIATFLIPGLGG